MRDGKFYTAPVAAYDVNNGQMQIDRNLGHRFLTALESLKTVRRREFGDRSPVYPFSAPRKLFVVENGYVRLVYSQADGREVTRMLLGQAALFGNIPFTPATFTIEESAITSGDCRVLEIGRIEMEDVARRDEEFRLLLLEMFATRMLCFERRLQWQLTWPVRARVARILADLICFSGGDCHHGHGRLVHVRLTHEEFAELTGVARPTVSVILKELRDANVIDYTASHLCIIDLNTLQCIADSQ